MFNKIVAIKYVGRFRSSANGGDTSLAKHNVIFGANGSGKTTICAILRSLRDGDSAHILGRTTLGETDTPVTPVIELLTTGGNIKFNGTAWSERYRDLAIFDGVFVTENVHVGDVVDADQKRNLYRVIVGADAVALAEQETKLAGESRAKATELGSITKAIQSHLPSAMKLDAFIALPKTDNIDELIVAKESQLTTIREAESIKNRPTLSENALPMLPAGFTELLAKTIDDIAKDAEERIAAHFTHHSLKNGSGWVAQGIDHAVEFCPFCGQNIQGLPLIAAYKTVFSDGYKALRVDLATTKATISKTFGDTALARLDTVAEQHKGSVEFWGKYCALDTAALAYPTSIVNTVKILGSVALALMERKERDPLERMDVDDAFLNAIATYEVEKNKIDAFNQAVRSANALISEKKTEAISADVTAATTELTHLKTINVRHSQVVAKLCNDHMKITGEKNNIEKQKNTIRDQLNKHTESVVKPYQARINDLLDAFNADFTIAETKHSYTGGVATSSYQLVINQTAIDIGGGNTPNHTPSFKNTLSAGDRSTLALAFFLAYLERDGGLSRKIVVFDDPFNSQDAFRRRQTILEIMKIASKCAQVIVLSHDATFLKQVWDKCPPAERSALNLSNHGTIGSKITAFDLDKACQGRTATDIDDLQSYVATRAGAHIDVIRKMRVVLETYMRSTYSADFGDVDYLGEIVGKIRKGATEHPAAALYDELNGINDYTAPYHHGENVADATPDVIDATELFGFVRKTLRIVNALQA